MDGKLHILGFLGLCGLGFFLGTGDYSLGAIGGGGSEAGLGKTGVKSVVQVVNLRHNELRRKLTQDGYDLNDPHSFVQQRDGEWIVAGPVAATEFLAPAFIETIADNHHIPASSERPKKILPAQVVENCAFTPPASGARLGHVFANGTLQNSAVYGLTAAELTAHARFKQLAEDKKNGKGNSNAVFGNVTTMQTNSAPGARPSGRYRFTVMDVVVSETEMPVHLVLQGGKGRILWNIHLAEGATLSGISALGGTAIGVANVPKRVPVQVMDAAGLAECGVAPAHLPLETAPLFTSVDDGTLSQAEARAELAEITQATEAWNTWFAGQFGLRADDTQIGYEVASIMALIGPLPDTPEARIPYRSLKGATLYTSPLDHSTSASMSNADSWLSRLTKDEIKRLEGVEHANADIGGTDQ